MATNIGTLEATITADASGFEKGLRAVRSGINRAAKTVGALGAAGAAAGVTIAGALGAKSIGAAASFEDAITSAAAKVDATEETMQAFEQAAISAGKASTFSARQAGNALEFLSQAGLSAEESTAALAGTLQLAEAGQLGLAEAADIATNVLSGMGMEVDQLSRVNDVLVKTSTSANTSVQELGQALSFVAPVAAGAGQSVEETSALLGALANAGIKASRAGTTLRSAIATLQSPTNKAQKVFDQLGISVTNSEGQMKSMTMILRQLEGAGISSAQVMQAFGKRAGPGMQALLQQGSQSIGRFTGKLEDSKGTASEMANFMRQSLGRQLDILKGSFQTLLITVGQKFAPVIKDTVGFMKDLTNRMTDQAGSGERLESVFKGLVIGAGQAAKAFASMGLAIAKAGDFVGDFFDIAQQSGATVVMQKSQEAIKNLRKEKARIKDQGTLSVADQDKIAQINSRIRSFKKAIKGAIESGKQADENRRNRAKTLESLQQIVNGASDGIDELSRRLRTNRDEMLETGSAARQMAKDFMAVSGIDLPGFEQTTTVGGVEVGASDLDKALGKTKGDGKGDGKSVSRQAAGATGAVGGGGGGGGRQGFKPSKELRQRSKNVERLKRQVGELQGIEQAVVKEQIRQHDIEMQRARLKQQQMPAWKKELELAKLKTREVKSQRKLEQRIAEIRKKRIQAGAGAAVAAAAGGARRGAAADIEGAIASAAGAGAGRGGGAGAAKKATEDVAQGFGEVAGKAQTLVGDISGMAQAMGKAAGASQGLTQGIGAIGSAATSVLSGIAQGGPVGIISGAIGAVTSLVSGFAGGGGAGGSSPSNRRDQKKFADILAKRIADEQEKRGLQPVEIDIAGRSQGTERRSGRSDRALGLADELDDARRRRGVGLGGE